MSGFFGAASDAVQAGQQRYLAGVYEGLGSQQQGVDQAAGKDALVRGVQQQGFQDLKAGQVAGAQTAGYAASGVDAGVGSPTTAAAGTAVMSAMNKAIIGNNAAREAWGYQVKGLQSYQQGLVSGLGSQYAAQNLDNKQVADDLGGVTQAATILGSLA